MWLGPSHRQAKQNGKTLELIGSLTICGDAQKESNKAASQPFRHIQSVKSTNKAMIRYTRIKQSEVRERWRR